MNSNVYKSLLVALQLDWRESNYINRDGIKHRERERERERERKEARDRKGRKNETKIRIGEVKL